MSVTTHHRTLTIHIQNKHFYIFACKMNENYELLRAQEVPRNAYMLRKSFVRKFRERGNTTQWKHYNRKTNIVRDENFRI